MNQTMRYLFYILPLVILSLLSAGSMANTTNPKVLMVVSSHGEEKGNAAPGYEFDEFAKAYLVFKQNGVEVDVASPNGGPVEADHYDANKPYNAKVLADNGIMTKLDNTMPTSDIDPSQYQAVFVVGGKGAMFDLPKDKALQTTIASIYERQGTVAAVCHGPAALVDVKLSNGEYLIANKAVNGFTNAEEQLFGKKWAKEFDFMLEDKLIERGGQFQSSDIMLNHVAVDGRLVTGQNPSSTVAVATELLKSMGIRPAAHTQYKDDMTLALVAKILKGDKGAEEQLSAGEDTYHMPLVGMYGYYYLNLAKSQQEYQNALTLMQLAQASINNPRLDMQIADAQHKIGDKQAATATLKQILQKTPDFEPAKAMLKTLIL